VLVTLIVPFFIQQNNSGNLDNEQSLCPFKMLTGFPCPGCGITKSIVYFYEGDIYKSLLHHLFGPIFVVFCLLVLFKLVAEIIYQKPFFDKIFYSMKLAYLMGILLGIYHLIRLFFYIKNNNLDTILKQSIWK
jgi:hypothetical protein